MLRRAPIARAAIAAAAALLACGSNNGTGAGPDLRLEATCWRLEEVVATGEGGEVFPLWSADAEPPSCGWSLCFASRGELGAEISCNSCSGFFTDLGDALESLAPACTDAACPCGPPFSDLPEDVWPVSARGEEELVIGFPAVSPGGAPVEWRFRRSG